MLGGTVVLEHHLEEQTQQTAWLAGAVWQKSWSKRSDGGERKILTE